MSRNIEKEKGLAADEENGPTESINCGAADPEP